MKKVIILGTGGGSVDILNIIGDLQKSGDQIECIGFLDDTEENQEKEFFGVKVLGKLTDAKTLRKSDIFFINGIGSPTNFWKKELVISKTNLSPDDFVTLVHPTAYIGENCSIGKGTAIGQNVTITSNVTIGNHVVVLPNSVISHDDRIQDYCCLASGACLASKVTVEQSSYLGMNCSVKEGLKIGKKSLVGMGAVVLKDIEDESVYVGNPARFIRKTNILD